MNAEAQALARNMSAPPRTTLTFSALAPASGATGDAVADGTGLAFVCRLDARALLPKSRAGDADASQLRARSRSRFMTASGSGSSTRRRKRRDASEPPPERSRSACATPVEAVADELRDLLAGGVARWRRPAAVRAVPAGAGERASPYCRASRGRWRSLPAAAAPSFCAMPIPIVWSAVEGEPLDLWMPAAPAGRVVMNARCDSAALAARIYSSFPGGAIGVLAPAAPARHRGDRHGAHRRGDAGRALAAAAQSEVRRRELSRRPRPRDAGAARAAPRGARPHPALPPPDAGAELGLRLRDQRAALPALSRAAPYGAFPSLVSRRHRCPRRCCGRPKAGARRRSAGCRARRARSIARSTATRRSPMRTCIDCCRR